MKTHTCLAGALGLLLTSTAGLFPQSNALPDGFPELEGLSLYLDAESLQLDGNHVTRMIDRSGRGNDAVEHVEPVPSKPTLLSGATPAGLDAIAFDGMGGYLEIPSNYPLLDGRARTTLVVFRPNSFGPGRIVNSAFSSLNPDNPDATPHYSVHSMFANVGGVLRIQNRTATGGGRAISTQNGSVTTGNFFVGANVWLDDGVSVVSVRNQADQRWVTEDENGGADATPSGHIWTRIGANAETSTPNPIDFFNGDVAAVLMYDRALAPEELDQMENYLRRVYLTGELEPSKANEPEVTAGLVVHLNASNVQVSGSTIEQVTDISNNNNHAISHVIEVAPPHRAPMVSSTTTPSGLGAVYFDGQDDYLEVAGNPTDFDGQSRTTLVVFRPHTLGVGRVINSAYAQINPSNPNSPHYSLQSIFARTGGDLRIQNRTTTGSGVAMSTSNNLVNTEEFVIGGSILIPGGGHVALVRNLANERFVTEGSGATAVPTGHIWTWIGANSSPGTASPQEHFHGEIAAVVIFNRALPPEELIEVEEFLHARYLQAPEGVSFQAWISGFDLPADQQAPGDNPAGDGISNLMKFAFDLDPMVSSRDGLPVVVLEGTGDERRLEILVTKNPLATGVNYVAEVSSNLADWFSGDEHIEILVDDQSILHGRDRTALSEENRRFMRVNVSLQQN